MTPELSIPSDADTTRERQYQRSLDLVRGKGPSTLGLMTNQAWADDPRHLLFTLAPLQIRGKNAVRAFACSGVLEVGCADAFGTRLVPREVRRLTAIDSDRVFVEDVLRRMDPRWSFECRQHDLLAGPVPGRFEVRLEAAYAMDVLEHIPAENEDLFVQNMVCSLTSEGLMERFFHNVFMSSMNDEMVHTGFAPMAHYIIGLGCSPRSGALKS